MNPFNKLSHLLRQTILLLGFVVWLFSPLGDYSNINAESLLQQAGPVYIIQAGDTLGDLELRFGASAEEIQAVNNIADPNSLFIGQSLIIPGLEGITGVLTSEILSIGASLDSLSRRYDLELGDLVLLNRLTSPSETIAGARFIIPIDEQKELQSPLNQLKTGETLLELAITSADSPWGVLEKNNLGSAWEVIPGEILYSPKGINNDFQPIIEVDAVWIDPLPAVQGETLQITILSEDGAKFTGSLGDSELTFHSEDGYQHYSFHGIHALKETGPILLQINSDSRNSSQNILEQLILLTSGNYGFEPVTGVDNETLEPDVNETEENFLLPFVSKNTSSRLWDGRFVYPVDEPCPSSPFGSDRDYNQGGLQGYHNGLDFRPCASNLNIYASAAGEVVLAEELMIKGNYVLINHGWGVFSAYAHLAEINVAVGQSVVPGDIVGIMGNTGRSTGPHLHFEIYNSGTPVNPQTWLNQEFPSSVP